MDANEMDADEMRLRFKCLVLECVQTEIYEALDKIKWAFINSVWICGIVYGVCYSATRHTEYQFVSIIVATVICYFPLHKLWSATAFSNYKKLPKCYVTSDLRILGNNDLDNSKYAIDPKTGRLNLHAGCWWH